MRKWSFDFSVILVLLFFVLSSYYYFVTQPIVVPKNSTDIAGGSFWLASVNIYLKTGKILMAPEAWRHFDNIDRTLIHFSSEGPFQYLIPLEEALGSDDQGYPFIQSVLSRAFGASEITYEWFIKFNYGYLIFLGLLASIFLFLSFRSFLICVVFYFLYLFVAHIGVSWVDYHWMIGALVIFYVSFLIYLLKQRQRFNYLWLVIYLAIGGWAEVIRRGDGLIGIILLLFSLVLLGVQDCLKKRPHQPYLKLSLKQFLLIILLIFIFITPELILIGVRNSRDQKYFDGRHSSMVTHHTIWHHAFIGLGYVQNDYGIKYDERWLGDFIKKVAPGVRDYSREEDILLRNLYMSYVWRTPSLLFDNLKAKFIRINVQIGEWYGKILPSPYFLKPLRPYTFYIVLVILFLISKKKEVDRSIFWLFVAHFY